jgi:hypothetical protein
MADGEISMGQLAEIVRDAMAALIESGDVDVVRSDDGQEIDVFGDEWTVHLEGWPSRPAAFAAIDDEPDDPAAIPAIRAAVIDGSVHAALLDLDRRLDGALKAALVATGDPLSIDLGMALGTAP